MPSLPQYIDGRGIRQNIIPASDTTRWRWMQRADDPFPAGVLIEGKRYWAVSEVLAWIDRQKAKAEGAAA